MEGHKKRIADLDTLELLKRLVEENGEVAKGAKVLFNHDINGAVFMDMVERDFIEIGGLSFGVRRSLLMFRKKIQEKEQVMAAEASSVLNEPRMANKYAVMGPSQARTKENNLGEFTPGSRNYQVKEVAGRRNYEVKEDANSVFNDFSEGADESVDSLFGNPKEAIANFEHVEKLSESLFDNPKDTANCVGEPSSSSVEHKDSQDRITIGVSQQPQNECISEDVCISSCGPISQSVVMSKPKESQSRNERSKSVIISKRNEALPIFHNASSVRVEYRNDKQPRESLKSLHPRLSLNSSIGGLSGSGPKKLRKLVFSGEVKWKEQGKERCSKDFMKMRDDGEIVREGYVQKLSGSNSK